MYKCINKLISEGFEALSVLCKNEQNHTCASAPCMLWNKSQNKWQLGYLGCVIGENSVMACMVRPFGCAFTRNQQYL
jgi:hypothetical protein